MLYSYTKTLSKYAIVIVIDIKISILYSVTVSLINVFVFGYIQEIETIGRIRQNIEYNLCSKTVPRAVFEHLSTKLFKYMSG